MRVDLCSAAPESPRGYKLSGSVGLQDGEAAALDNHAGRFISDLFVAGLDGQRVVPEDGFEYLRALPYNIRGSHIWAQWNFEDLDLDAVELLFARLRRVASTSTVARSLPVLFFGDFLTARAVTVALNPSNREYLAKNGGHLLAGSQQRFATLDTYGRDERPKLTDAECADAISWMRGYFEPGRPWYRPYFGHLERFLDGAGFSFHNGSAAHLDLVQESTKPVWRDLPPDERSALLASDLPFLEWQLGLQPLDSIFCNGRTVSDCLRDRLNVTETQTGSIGKLQWWAGLASTAGRRVPIVGWNHPLNQATGLDGPGERDFGRLIASVLSA